MLSLASKFDNIVNIPDRKHHKTASGLHVVTTKYVFLIRKYRAMLRFVSKMLSLQCDFVNFSDVTTLSGLKRLDNGRDLA